MPVCKCSHTDPQHRHKGILGACTAHQCVCSYFCQRSDNKCAECGRIITNEMGGVERFYRDECPTDRGTEVREGWEWVCSECMDDLLHPTTEQDCYNAGAEGKPIPGHVCKGQFCGHCGAYEQGTKHEHLRYDLGSDADREPTTITDYENGEERYVCPF